MLNQHSGITDPIAQEILKGASELFMRYGVKSITMDEIARHLSISKKTIYQHFTDKDELVLTFAREAMHRQQSQILEMEKNYPNIIEGIMQFSDFLKCTVTLISPGLLFDLKKYFPKAWKIFLDFKKEFLKDHIKRILIKGVEDGIFRKDLDIEIIARLRIEQIEISFNPDIFPAAEFNLNEVHTQIFQHFFMGMCTNKGYEEFIKIFSKA